MTLDRDYLDDRRFPPAEGGGVLVIHAPDERLLSVELTEQGVELRNQALGVPPAVMQRLGMSLPDLQALHASLTRVIAAADPVAATAASQP